MNVEEKLTIATEALNDIVWISYCGIDGRDEHGIYRNWPIQERDEMYKIAVKTLIKIEMLSETMKDAERNIKE